MLVVGKSFEEVDIGLAAPTRVREYMENPHRRYGGRCSGTPAHAIAGVNSSRASAREAEVCSLASNDFCSARESPSRSTYQG